MTFSEWRAVCAADLRANAGYPKSRAVLLSFRTAQFVRGSRTPWGRLAYLFVGTFYKLFSEWLLGIELPASTPVGPGLRLRHGVGVVVNPHARIGADVLLRHAVTIGNRRTATDCPVIEDGVELGVGAVIIGDIVVGAGTKVGAGVVLTVSVPPGSVVKNPVPVIRSPQDAG